MASFGNFWEQGQGAASARQEDRSTAFQQDDRFTRTTLKALSPHQSNAAVVGLVLAKHGVRSFPDKKNPGSMLWKLMFTIRDSPSHYANVVCWGSEDYIPSLSDSFRINDVVEIKNPSIQTKGGLDDKWRPTTSSPLQLVLSERYSSLSRYNGWDYNDFVTLAHIPIRSVDDFQALASVLSQGTGQVNREGALVNLLAAVRSVGAPRQITGRTGRALQRCEVRLMDQTCLSFSLFIWDQDVINLAQSWTSKQTVLFIVDVQVKYDDFRQAVVATCGAKTVIITNPDCPAGHKLYQFAQQANVTVENEADDGQGAMDVSSITDVYTVNQLKRHIAAKPEYSPSSVFTGIVYAVLTSLDIDTDSYKSVIGQKCSSCKGRFSRDSPVCQNPSCTAYGSDSTPPELYFDLKVTVADHTDGVSVWLSGQPAEAFLQCSAQQYVAMTRREKVQIRSKLLLERWKFYLKAFYHNGANSLSATRVHVVAVEPVNMEEMTKLL